jgi:hypothetical protein
MAVKVEASSGSDITPIVSELATLENLAQKEIMRELIG